MTTPEPTITSDEHAGTIELTDAMLDAGADALDVWDNRPIPADHHERWGIVSLILVAALRESPYPAHRLAAPPAAPDAGETMWTEEELFYAMREHLDIDMCRSLLAEDDMRWAGPSLDAQIALSKIVRALAQARGAGRREG